MKLHDYLICYDIADKKRLVKISKLLERTAARIQYSIYFYPKVAKESINELKDKLNELINQEEDDIRIYKIDIKNSIHLKSGIDLQNPFVI
ncbi:CRISPR-associated endonuclease Cas2 [Aliarcobacter lanthieri]|uniref:CRISPR-associated endonuclease Cas2 n=1 Tax=Aliarcobacter lanthieri TaxID=1355374 RepID=UPI003AAC343B